MKFILWSFMLLSMVAWGAELTPTTRVNQSMDFADDMNYQNLDLAIQRQLNSYITFGLSGDIRFGTLTYPKEVLRKSLVELKTLSSTAATCQKSKPRESCDSEFNLAVNEKFAIYKTNPKSTEHGYAAKKTQFTSYYSPDFTGSRVQTSRFTRAIYGLPANPAHRNFTRVEIDYHGALAGYGYELFWVEESFFDLYLLHVQGGGRIKLQNPDGTEEIKYLSYNGKNTRSFQMIYKYMVQRGYLSADAGVPAQRRFLEQNPDKEEEIFGSSPSYVYFKESVDEPVGLNNIPLTEGRSVAMDNTIYKTTGLINFVKTVKASHISEAGTLVKIPFSRFFISQDTGGAIRGNSRCDLYFGYGPMAELTAYNMNELGEQYILVLK